MSSREKAMKREFVLQGSLESLLQRPPKSGGLWKGDRMGCSLCKGALTNHPKRTGYGG